MEGDEPVNDFEVFSAEEMGNAWQALRKQVENGEPLTWTGPDRLHYRILAGSPSPSEAITDRWLAAGEEQGRDIWDTLFIIAFQLGYHNGTVVEEKRTEYYQRLNEQIQFEHEASGADGIVYDD